jgi:8-hydroxy-5-deazaflavin:NADPH oxidoreductase
MAKRIGVLGSGEVAKVLSGGFKKHGYEVKIGSRDAAKLAAFSGTSGIPAGTFADVAAFAEIVVLAVKGTAAKDVLKLTGEATAGKIVIDACNPIAEEPPNSGVVRFFTGPNDSLMERLQASHPKARFVKAFNSVGSGFMVDPSLPGGPPTMFICGNDAEAKKEVTAILTQLGWDSADMGMVESARAIEPLCQLWCAPGLLRNQWTHAFKLLKL